MAFFNRFPYTNFHELNLDWILEKINEITGLNLVKTVNNKSADADGNIALGVDDIPGAGTVKKVNNIDPDSSGNVTIDSTDVPGTVRSVNWFAPDPSTGNVNLSPVNIGAVATVNNTAPDPLTGNVNAGTVKSVNNTQPDANGNVNLPTVSGVTSVNGIGADGTGNVQLDALDVDAVATVNGIPPDNTGDVELTARLIGAVATVNNISPVNGNVTIAKSDIDSIINIPAYSTDGISQTYAEIKSGGYFKIGNVVVIAIRLETISAITAGSPLFTGLPQAITSISTSSGCVPVFNTLGKNMSLSGNGRIILASTETTIPVNTVMMVGCVYLENQ